MKCDLLPTSLTCVVGRRDYPTDGVRDYCGCLAAAFARRGVALALLEVPAPGEGWGAALARLGRARHHWAGRWVLLQYTHGAWPWRGFPLGFIRLVTLLQRGGAHTCITFHDPLPFPGARVQDRLRQQCQTAVMRRAASLAERVVVTVPPARVPWLRRSPSRAKARHIPVGSNVGACPAPRPPMAANGARAVAVFEITGGPHQAREVAEIAHAVRVAAQSVPGLHLVVFGRGSREAAPALQAALAGSRVAISVRGLLPSDRVVELLRHAHVQLFVRGPVSPRRTSAVAGIACGLPLVAYQGDETTHPVTEAGVLMVPAHDVAALGRALARVLSDEPTWRYLHERSLAAYHRYFAWDVLAGQYLDLLRDAP